MNKIGDPASGCEKTFTVEFECPPGGVRLREQLGPGAGLNNRIALVCPGAIPDSLSLQIHSATYGGNCGTALGNATRDIRKWCRGRVDCDYVIDVGSLGDPAHGCGKDYVVDYSCPGDQKPRSLKIPAEAGLGERIRLACPPTPSATAGSSAGGL